MKSELIVESTRRNDFFKNIKVDSDSKVYFLSEKNFLYSANTHPEPYLRFPQMVYDFLPILSAEKNLLVVSEAHLPLLFFEEKKLIYSFNQLKPNSEIQKNALTLSYRAGKLLQGGKCLLSLFDTFQMKICETFSVSNVSCANFLSENLIGVGFFDGKQEIRDLRANSKNCFSRRVHMDAVFQVEEYSSMSYATSARSDDFVYLWVF